MLPLDESLLRLPLSLSEKTGVAANVSIGPLQFNGTLVNLGGPTSLDANYRRFGNYGATFEPTKSSEGGCARSLNQSCPTSTVKVKKLIQL